MIFEAAADQPDAVGEQRRGQRVAGEAVHALAVEAKRERRDRSISPPAASR